VKTLASADGCWTTQITWQKNSGTWCCPIKDSGVVQRTEMHLEQNHLRPENLVNALHY
jgi:hypothetical protein